MLGLVIHDISVPICVAANGRGSSGVEAVLVCDEGEPHALLAVSRGRGHENACGYH